MTLKSAVTLSATARGCDRDDCRDMIETWLNVTEGTGQKASFGLVPRTTYCPVHCEMSFSSRSRTSSVDTTSGTATAASAETATSNAATESTHLIACPSRASRLDTGLSCSHC